MAMMFGQVIPMDFNSIITFFTGIGTGVGGGLASLWAFLKYRAKRQMKMEEDREKAMQELLAKNQEAAERREEKHLEIIEKFSVAIDKNTESFFALKEQTSQAVVVNEQLIQSTKTVTDQQVKVTSTLENLTNITKNLSCMTLKQSQQSGRDTLHGNE
jgi:hypothetical protein